MKLAWKPNWSEAQQHYLDWWNHRGLVLGMWGAPPARAPHEAVARPAASQIPNGHYADAEYKSRYCHWLLAQKYFGGDLLPVADTSIGPGSLALVLGATPGFSPETVWYHPSLEQVESPEQLPPLRFDPQNAWWQVTEQTVRSCAERGRGRYLAGFPDLVENLDTLAALRGTQTVLMDCAIRPEWVREKIREINQVWFEVFDRLYDLAKLEDGSSAFWAFYAWGPGKTAKVQCDISSMISPEMFRELVVPSLTEQCEWLDHSVYHLDGSQCLCHLDALLEIEALDAIEWTPDPAVPNGGSLHWRDLYRRILDAGKSVQLVNVRREEVLPMLDAIGGKGVYILTNFETEAQVDELSRKVAQYR